MGNVGYRFAGAWHIVETKGDGSVASPPSFIDCFYPNAPSGMISDPNKTPMLRDQGEFWVWRNVELQLSEISSWMLSFLSPSLTTSFSSSSNHSLPHIDLACKLSNFKSHGHLAISNPTLWSDAPFLWSHQAPWHHHRCLCSFGLEAPLPLEIYFLLRSKCQSLLLICFSYSLQRGFCKFVTLHMNFCLCWGTWRLSAVADHVSVTWTLPALSAQNVVQNRVQWDREA